MTNHEEGDSKSQSFYTDAEITLTNLYSLHYEHEFKSRLKTEVTDKGNDRSVVGWQFERHDHVHVNYFHPVVDRENFSAGGYLSPANPSLLTLEVWLRAYEKLVLENKISPQDITLLPLFRSRFGVRAICTVVITHDTKGNICVRIVYNFPQRSQEVDDACKTASEKSKSQSASNHSPTNSSIRKELIESRRTLLQSLRQIKKLANKNVEFDAPCILTDGHYEAARHLNYMEKFATLPAHTGSEYKPADDFDQNDFYDVNNYNLMLAHREGRSLGGHRFEDLNGCAGDFERVKFLEQARLDYLACPPKVYHTKIEVKVADEKTEAGLKQHPHWLTTEIVKRIYDDYYKERGFLFFGKTSRESETLLDFLADETIVEVKRKNKVKYFKPTLTLKEKAIEVYLANITDVNAKKRLKSIINKYRPSDTKASTQLSLDHVINQRVNHKHKLWLSDHMIQTICADYRKKRGFIIFGWTSQESQDLLDLLSHPGPSLKRKQAGLEAYLKQFKRDLFKPRLWYVLKKHKEQWKKLALHDVEGNLPCQFDLENHDRQERVGSPSERLYTPNPLQGSPEIVRSPSPSTCAKTLQTLKEATIEESPPPLHRQPSIRPVVMPKPTYPKDASKFADHPLPMMNPPADRDSTDSSRYSTMSSATSESSTSSNSSDRASPVLDRESPLLETPGNVMQTREIESPAYKVLSAAC